MILTRYKNLKMDVHIMYNIIMSFSNNNSKYIIYIYGIQYIYGV